MPPGRHAAAMADALGDSTRAARLLEQAEALRVAFETQFWCEEEGTYALALDGRKRPCRVRASNAGHCLFGGIASTERARRVAEMLVGPDMFSGWGIRTIAAGEHRYNPMSYHNGSVWPHDNGLTAAGFSRYGFDDLRDEAVWSAVRRERVDGRVSAAGIALWIPSPPGEGPTLYPVACSPQAWASGVVFQLIQACARLSVEAEASRLVVRRPVLPPFLNYLKFTDLELPFGVVDLLMERGPDDVKVTVLGQSAAFQVEVTR